MITNLAAKSASRVPLNASRMARCPFTTTIRRTPTSGRWAFKNFDFAFVFFWSLHSICKKKNGEYIAIDRTFYFE